MQKSIYSLEMRFLPLLVSAAVWTAIVPVHGKPPKGHKEQTNATVEEENPFPGMCGQSSFPIEGVGRHRIIRGHTATPHSFPWIVRIEGIVEWLDMKTRTANVIDCAGSLLRVSDLKDESDIVITTRSCAERKVAWNLFFGVHDQEKMKESTHRRGKKLEFPKYNDSDLSDDFSNDIALIKLDSPVRFTSKIQPVCLPLPRDKVKIGEVGIVAGWGQDDPDVDRVNHFPAELQYVHVPVVDASKCLELFNRWNHEPFVWNSAAMICAGNGWKETSVNDGGGPYIFKRRAGYTLEGIIGLGRFDTGTPESGGTYTRVSYHMDWIVQTMSKITSVPA